MHNVLTRLKLQMQSAANDFSWHFQLKVHLGLIVHVKVLLSYSFFPFAVAIPMLYKLKEEPWLVSGHHAVVVVVTSFLISTVVITCLWNPEVSTIFSSFQSDRSFSKKIEDIPKDELERVLSSASMANNTLIITMINKAYARNNSMLDLFLRSFEIGDGTGFLVNHLLFVAVDHTSYDRCMLFRLHCYKLVTEGVDFSKEVVYMSKDFIKMTWSRTLFLGEVLKRGYNFIFTDLDVMWLRNPFQKLSQEGEDMQISSDWYNGNPFNLKNGLNTGFYYVSSNNKTIALFDLWYASRENATGSKEQDVLQWLMKKGAFGKLGVDLRFLDPWYFASFCRNHKNFREVRVVHASCCRTMKAKLADLDLLLDEWKRYNGTTPNTKMMWTDTPACLKSWQKKV